MDRTEEPAQTNAAILNFLLAIVLHPEVARRAQAEVDEVMGNPEATSTDPSWQVPSLADRKRMPYVECVLREVLRWNPPAPFGKVFEYGSDEEHD